MSNRASIYQMLMTAALLMPAATVLAHSTPGGQNEFVEGSGWYARAGQKTQLALAAYCDSGQYRGHFEFRDKALNLSLRNAQITSITASGDDTRIVEGTAQIVGAAQGDVTDGSFRATVTDGSNAAVIELSNGYAAGGNLQRGDLRIHRHPGPSACSQPPPADITPPTVVLTEPTDGAIVSGLVTLTADASDDQSGVASVQFLVDGAAIGSEDTTAPYSVDWDSTLVANGSHTVTAMARDVAGNTANSASATITVNNNSGGGGGGGETYRIEETDPAVAYKGTWATATDSSLSGGSVTESNTASDTATVSFTGTGITWIGYRCTCAAGVANLYVDGNFVASTDTYSASREAQAKIYTVSGLAQGNHTFRIEVTGQYNSNGETAYIVVDAFDIQK